MPTAIVTAMTRIIPTNAAMTFFITLLPRKSSPHSVPPNRGWQSGFTTFEPSCPERSPSEHDPDTRATRIADRTRATDATHAAEVVMEPIPAPDDPPVRLQAGQGSFIDPGLGVDDVERGVDPRARDGLVRREPFVEDAGEDRGKGGAQPRRAGRAYRERETLPVEGEA